MVLDMHFGFAQIERRRAAAAAAAIGKESDKIVDWLAGMLERLESLVSSLLCRVRKVKFPSWFGLSD
jgi:hypothetical protein